MHPRLLQLGDIAIPTYGVFAALALVAALLAAVIAARKLGLDPDQVWNLGLIGILTALIGSRLILIAAHLADFAAHPFWLLGVSSVRSNAALYGGMAMAVAAGLLYASAVGLPLLRALDALAPGVALAEVIRGLGTFFAGMEFGTPTTLPWSVSYSSRIASLWYGTPIGVRVHPVQLYGSFVQLAILCVLVSWIGRRKQDGELAAAWLFLTGLSAFLLDLLRGDQGRSWLIDGALNISQVFAVAMVVLGGLLGLERRRRELTPREVPAVDQL